MGDLPLAVGGRHVAAVPARSLQRGHGQRHSPQFRAHVWVKDQLPQLRSAPYGLGLSGR